MNAAGNVVAVERAAQEAGAERVLGMELYLAGQESDIRSLAERIERFADRKGLSREWARRLANMVGGDNGAATHRHTH